MTLGISLPSHWPDLGSNTVDTLIARAREAGEAGLTSIWLPQRFDHDALSIAAVIGHAVPDIAIGTSVVPIYPRHPIVVSSQAQTAQAASHGRFTLGLGLGTPRLITSFGVSFDRPIRHLREYLSALRPLLSSGSVNLHGATLTASTPMPAAVPGAQPPVPLLVAAMGPQALKVTGELADGTLPYLAGPRTLSEFIVPTITEAARAAGRPAPRIVVAFAGIVTAAVDKVRASAEKQLASYATVPSYRAVLAREGLKHPAELAVIGDEEMLAAAVALYFDAGATEIVVTSTGLSTAEDRRRTWKVLGEINRGRTRSAR
ncbi:LLM class F420-dependent oxidoreductase [Candidatus Protofrankia californiensis]|uniref:LLM class F420-dependent oxidoreductase n=1 Tax=Candidatus Protofrankia californiensis TaxID=1839754 RepID=UPI001F4959FD|nr:LLM class F420-dependent oxidoreductase [Candidatus Protofrankia californiensis]